VDVSDSGDGERPGSVDQTLLPQDRCRSAKYAGRSMRSGYVTSAVEVDAPLLKIAEQTRHPSLDMLRIYSRRITRAPTFSDIDRTDMTVTPKMDGDKDTPGSSEQVSARAPTKSKLLTLDELRARGSRCCRHPARATACQWGGRRRKKLRFIAPYDLSTELGVSGRFDVPEYRDAVTHLESVILKAGIPLGSLASTRDQTRDLIKRGYWLPLHGCDILMLTGIVRQTEEWRRLH
jgi:hypothetical protein